ncbi:MAG: hypothetical protein WC471_05730 [Candidatus Woesearchaeota archaeon]
MSTSIGIFQTLKEIVVEFWDDESTLDALIDDRDGSDSELLMKIRLPGQMIDAEFLAREFFGFYKGISYWQEHYCGIVYYNTSQKKELYQKIKEYFKEAAFEKVEKKNK